MPDPDEFSVLGNASGMPIIDIRAIQNDLYVHALNSVYGTQRVWEPSYASRRDPDIWEKVRRDAVIASCINQRLHSIAAREWRVLPGGNTDADNDAAAVIEEMLQDVPKFLESRLELAHAVFLGSAYCYIGGRHRVETFNEMTANWWIPNRLKDIDRRRFRWMSKREDASDGSHPIRTWLEYWSLSWQAWREADPTRFVRHTYNDEEGRLGYGRGLMEAIYFYHYIKGVVLREGLQGLERWAQGMVIAKLDGTRAASSGKSNEKVKSDFLKELNKMRARHALVMEGTDELEILNGPGQGYQVIEQWRTYVDNAVTRLILGSVRPTGGDTKTGARAASETESDTTEQLIQYDRMILDETITRDLITEIWRNNRPALTEVGLGSAKMPKFSSVQEKKADPVEAAQVITTLLGAGVKVRTEEVYERTGLTPPGPDDEVIEGQVGPSPFGGLPTLSLPTERVAS